MPQVFTSKTQKIGELGEEIACKYLRSKGFEIVERNYTKKWGEIDIVAKSKEKFYFIEVKSVSRSLLNSVGGESENSQLPLTDSYRPEENMHPWKIKRLSRTIEIYLSNKNVLNDWQVDLLCVYMDTSQKKAKVEVFSNIF